MSARVMKQFPRIRSSWHQVLKFGGEKNTFQGVNILFFIICLKQIFVCATKFGGHKNLGGAQPSNDYGPGWWCSCLLPIVYITRNKSRASSVQPSGTRLSSNRATRVRELVCGPRFQVPQSELDAELTKKILAEYRVHNADVILKEDSTADDLIDVIEGNRVYIPCIYILNKIDQVRASLERGKPFPPGFYNLIFSY